jgi:hypothetical protein
MTKKERMYLRSAYHHYDNSIQKSSRLARDIDDLVKFVQASIMLKEICFLVLSLDGDYDGQTEERINEIFNEEGINILE